MKKKTFGLVVIIFFAMLFTIFTLWRLAMKTTTDVGNIADIEWYSEAEKEFTITTVEELYDLVALSDFYDFEGQTIKLGADIVVNEGNARDWAEAAPENRWHPITGFAGTFDGQGHTISGLYGKTADNSMGLFTDTQKNCVIQNFSLKNSYFYTTGRKGTGSVVGEGSGTFKRIYSDAIVVTDAGSQNKGGLIGKIDAKSTMEECWFDGYVKSDDIVCAGLVALIYNNATLTMTNCLNSGVIECTPGSKGLYAAGFVGNLQSNEANRLNMSDCLNVGKIEAAASNMPYTGSVIGRLSPGTSLNMTNSYATTESYAKAIGQSAGTRYGTALLRDESLITGYGGYQWLNLDFDKYWAVDMEGTPILQYFADEVPDLTGVARKFNVDWYDKTKTEFVINTIEEFIGFSMLSYEVDFTGKTVKLGADITLNTGDAKKWAEEAPEYQWFPLELYKGNFDGQGHTISGLYVKATQNKQGMISQLNIGSIVENFRLENSYFESPSVTGSIVGQGGGTLRNIYSNAIVKTDTEHAGGIIGSLNKMGTISNCWFDGEVILGTRYGGGITGSIMSESGKVEHCLNTGTITSAKTGNVEVGGIVGIVTANGTISDSLNAGKITVAEGAKRVGSVVGRSGSDAQKFTITNSYGINDDCGAGLGSGSAYGYAPVNSKAELSGNGGYQRTALDFENYWAINKNGTPVLKSFADTVPTLPNIKRAVAADVSWYDDAKTSFTIKTAEQLYGFAILASKYNFEGKTVKLGANITFNTGDAASWENSTPINSWPTIGIYGSKARFAGTFDGQGYIISGLYTDCGKNENWIGLFSATDRTSVIKNVSVKNSLFKADSTSRVGGIAGSGSGTFDTIYCDAILISAKNGVGGIVGDGYDLTITNCWYDGTIYSRVNGNAYTGGILGLISSGKATISHCLNSGDIISSADKTKGPRIGGIVGSIDGGEKTNVAISDCFNTGVITTAGATSQVGSMVGRQTAPKGVSTPLTVTNTYATAESSELQVRASGTVIKDNVKAFAESLITGIGAYQRMNLDYSKYWSMRTAKTPVLTRFAQSGEILSLAGVNVERASDMVKDTSWYNEAKGTASDPYIIKDVADLFGFAKLVNEGNDFKNKTVKLTADIQVNNGNAADWATAEPLTEWIPLGTSKVMFAGTFDGGGHTISGLYHDLGTASGYVGFFAYTAEQSVIKNLRVTNTYFAYTGDKDNARIGGIVAAGAGKLDTVYCDAILISGALGTGGMVGTNRADLTMTNCWFAGTVNSLGECSSVKNYKSRAGGMIGTVGNGTTDISNCLNTGTIHSGATTGAPCVGGLVGHVDGSSATLTITDSLNTGNITTDGATSTIRTLVGGKVKGTVSIRKSYSTNVGMEMYASSGIDASQCVSYDKEKLLGMGGYQRTVLDFTQYWAALANETPKLRSFVDTSLALNTTGVIRLISADTTWVEETTGIQNDPYIIKDAADLYGLAELVNTGMTFDEKYIILANDITVNTLLEGQTVEDWANVDKAPVNIWTPIGKTSGYSKFDHAFKGTFDGQNHKITGLYAYKSSASSLGGAEYFLGLFGWALDATIKDVKVIDSYIAGTGKVSAIIGQGKNTTLENVYTNAYIDGGTSGDSIGGMVGLLNGGTLDSCTFEGTIKGKQNVGGMIGYFDVAGSISNSKTAGTITATGQAIGGMVGYNPTQLDIDNCWFDGTITGGKYIGGMVGYTHWNTSTHGAGTISNCLSSGTLHATDQQVGGLLGHMNTGRTIKLVNCLSVSTVTGLNPGSVIGYHNDGTLSIDSTYGYSDPNVTSGARGVSGGKSQHVSATEQVGSATAVTLEEITGTNAYVNTKLAFDDLTTTDNFDGVWVARQNNTPMLRSFASTSEIQSLFGTDTAVTADTSWYDAATGSESDPYVLSDAADLYGFAAKVNEGTTFADRYIILDKNIIVNASDSSNWDETAPVNAWVPIGNSGSKTFNGNFNGNGYTISGLYGNLGTAGGNMGLFGFCGSGCKISNVNLKNSYFVYSGTTDSTTMGAIAVLGRGEITSVYCNATLESSGLGTGGIVGTKRSALTLTNCWFAGKIDTSGCAAKSNHTWSGGLIGFTNGASTTINHCFVTGTISTSVISGTVRQGGFIGSAHGSGTVSVTDSLNAAVMTTDGATIRSLIGGMVNGTVELTNCYATDNNIDLCGSNVTTENCGVFGEDSVLSADYWVTVSGSSTPILKVFQ